MNRRNILKFLAISSIFSASTTKISLGAEKSRKKLKGKPLVEGDLVSIVAPGSAVSSPDDLTYAKEILQKLDLKYEFAPNLKKGSGYKTRTISERVEDIHFAFESNSKAVFCIRGGYGSASLLPYINYEKIKSNPKIFAGYSDITALHLGIYKETGLVTFHSPVLLSNFNEITFKSFKKIIFGDTDDYTIKNPINSTIREAFPVHIINEGQAKGELTGGNLSLITSLMGTKYEIETDNKILFIEDIGEEPYKIHRMLTQLRIASKLENLRGVVIGKCIDCSRKSTGTWDQSEIEVYYDILDKYRYPIIYGLLLGHTDIQFTLPLYLNYKISTENKSISLIENPYS